MIKVVLNGKGYQLEEPGTVAHLIKKLELEGKLAVEINRNIIPQSCYESHNINPGDSIEIVEAIGGG